MLLEMDAKTRDQAQKHRKRMKTKLTLLYEAEELQEHGMIYHVFRII